jgi:hypothetical protein
VSDRPGREMPKEYRKVAAELVDNQGWSYHACGIHPRLYPADPTQPMVTVPTTPGDRRSLANFIAEVRRRGGSWPPS